MTDETKRLVEAARKFKANTTEAFTPRGERNVWDELEAALVAVESTPPVTDPLLEQMAEALEKAHTELNAIRARDGVPHTSEGWPYGVAEDYFSSVVDGCRNALATYRQRKEGL